MEQQGTSWPEEAPGVLGLAQIGIRAQAPGPLEQLDRWGLKWSPICNDAGSVLAARLETDDPDRAWQFLAQKFAGHGLWPVCSRDLTSDVLASPDQIPEDAETILRDQLAREAAAIGEEFNEVVAEQPWRAPLSGLAPRQRPGSAPVDLYANSVDNRDLIVVPVTRPADVPAVLGWLGPTNYGLTAGEVSCVLRSWEDRFGATLMNLDFDVMELQVPFPPRSPADIELTAREHYAFCPDNIDQGCDTLEAYLPSVARIAWGFWWD